VKVNKGKIHTVDDCGMNMNGNDMNEDQKVIMNYDEFCYPWSDECAICWD
jgi:hypothetical protein